MAKIICIVMSGEKQRVNMSLAFTKKMKEDGNEMRILFWGPSEKLIAEDEEIRNKVKEASSLLHPKACMNFVKNMNIDSSILEDSMELLPAATYIAKSVDEGYTTLTF